jgi:hypothetical protein
VKGSKDNCMGVEKALSDHLRDCILIHRHALLKDVRKGGCFCAAVQMDDT